MARPDYYTAASGGAVLQALIDEYFLEFPAEGVIWWALIRLDKIWDYNSYLIGAIKDNTIQSFCGRYRNPARDKNSALTRPKDGI